MGNQNHIIEHESSILYDIPSFNPDEEYDFLLNNPENFIEEEVKLIDYDNVPIYFNTNKNCTTESAVKENNKNDNSKLTEVIPCGEGKCLKKQEKEIEKENNQKKYKKEETEKTVCTTEQKEKNKENQILLNNNKDSNDKNNNIKETNSIMNENNNNTNINNNNMMININNNHGNVLDNFLNNINNDMFDNNNNDNNNEYKMLGKKKIRYNDNEKKGFSLDNLFKNIRKKALNIEREFINEKIYLLLKNELGEAYFLKLLLKIELSSHSDVAYDKAFINKKLKEIFSFNINGKYTDYPKDNNKKNIQFLITHEKFGNYFESLFELTFLDCLEHIIGKKNSDLLEGIPKIDDIIEKGGKDVNKYGKEKYKEYFMGYKDMINEKKSRKSKKVKGTKKNI